VLSVNLLFPYSMMFILLKNGNELVLVDHTYMGRQFPLFVAGRLGTRTEAQKLVSVVCWD
jgi:hypothetical protein